MSDEIKALVQRLESAKAHEPASLTVAEVQAILKAIAEANESGELATFLALGNG